MAHKDWIEAFTEYYDHYEKGDVLDKDEAPDTDAELVYWPKASTVAAFLARVCQHPKRVALTTAAGFSLSAAAAKALKEEAVDEDVLEQYARAVSKQHAKVDEELKKAAAWPKVMKAAVADIKLSIKGNPNVKRTVAQLDSKKPTYLYDILDKLQTTYGDKHEDQKVDVLLAHIFLIFSSGDTADVHADKVRTSLAEVEKVCGAEMTMEKLTSVLFESHLRLFDVFKIVSQSMAQLAPDASLEDKLKIFEDAMRSEDAITIPREDLQRAVQALVVKVFKDVKVPKAARGDGGGRGRGYGRGGARGTPRAQANLGGAAPDEGVLAFFTQNDKGGKGGGWGNPNPNTQKETHAQNAQHGRPPQSCSICWEVGHFAKECRSIPHLQSTHPTAQAYHRKGPLWAGRGSGPATAHMATHSGGNSGQRSALSVSDSNAAFVQHNRVAFDAFMDAQVPASFISLSADTSFAPTDAEKERHARRRLTQRRIRPKPGKQLIEAIVDSGASTTLGPEDLVRRLAKNVVEVERENVAGFNADAPKVDINCKGNLFGTVRVEKGHSKAVEMTIRGVKGMDRVLWSLPDLYRANAVVKFCKPEKGSMGIQLDGSLEWIPMEFVDDKYFAVQIDVSDRLSLSIRQKQEQNFRTSCLTSSLDQRILAETARRNLVRNFKYHPEVTHGTDETSLQVKGQMAPFPAEKQWRPSVVGALTYMDVAVIDKGMAANSNAKFMLDVHDAASNFRTRYYLRNLSNLHLWVRKYRNFVRRKGHMFVHLTADNQFDTAGLEELAAQDPTFDYSFCAPYSHSQNPAETTIKAWRLRVRAAIKTAQQDPQSKVGNEHWPYISECITDIENMTFSAACPSTTPWEAFYREQPDFNLWQIPGCRIWYFVYPDLRKNAPFADRRCEGMFVGLHHASGCFKILNLSTGRVLHRRFADCVTREPHEVFNYADTVRAAEVMYGQPGSQLLASDRSAMFEAPVFADNLEDIENGNVSNVNYIGPKPVGTTVAQSSNIFELLSEEDSESDIEAENGLNGVQNNEVSSSSDHDSDDEIETTAVKVGSMHKWTAKRIAKHHGVSVEQLAEYNGDEHGNQFITNATKFNAEYTLNIPVTVSYAQVGSSQALCATDKVHEVTYSGLLAQTVQALPEASLFADAVLGIENPAVSKVSDALPNLVHAISGRDFEQHQTVDMSATRKIGESRNGSLREAVHQAFLSDLTESVKQPSSYEAGLKDPQQRKHWLAGDAVESKRCKDFDAYDVVPYSVAVQSGEYVGHVLRIIRIKEVSEKGVTIEREYKVRYAYDEARNPDDDGEEHFAAVMRTQTSRLLNLKACRLRRKVMRGDLVSAFLHVTADKPFYTRFPKGHPEEFINGIRQAMKWKKLLYGKGTASRGLWHDFAATLIALGFKQHSAVDQCLFTHAERDIDVGLYVDDIEASAVDEQLQWLRDKLNLRYECKWLGFNSKDCDESSEKSKVFVGIRTEIDHSTQTMTQDQTALIQKAAVRFKWDGKTKFAPPVQTVPFPDLADGVKPDPIFHKRYRSKVGFVAHLAVQTRFDINQHAVKAARRLNDPVPECEAYIDQVLQFLFSTMDDRLNFSCKQNLSSTLLISSDAAHGDTADGRSTTGWISSLCGGAWAWGVDTLRLAVMSSTEAEYCAAANACKEVLAQQALFAAFRLDFPKHYPVLIDNQSAISLACGPAAHHQRTKHIASKYHFQRKLLLDGVVRYQHQASEYLVADLLTKDLVVGCAHRPFGL